MLPDLLVGFLSVYNDKAILLKLVLLNYVIELNQIKFYFHELYLHGFKILIFFIYFKDIILMIHLIFYML